MWQGDWKEFELDGSKKWLVAFMDDSSCLITCYGVLDSPTTENTIIVLNQGFREYGTPREILTDHGTQFVSARNREHGQHKFRDFLDQHDIKHIVVGVKHSQTNGKSNGSSERSSEESISLVLLRKSFIGTMPSSLT